MYRFAVRPWWLVSHVLVLALIVGLASLGFWQLRRLDERREQNARIEAAVAAESVPIDRLAVVDPDDVEYRTVFLDGGTLGSDTVLIDNRSSGGSAGAWVIRPYALESGTTVLVNLGFVPYAGGLTVELPEPDGSATDGGPFGQAILRTDADRSCARADAGQDDVVARFNCVDVDAIADALDIDDVAPVEARMVAPSLALQVGEATGPTPLPPPETDDGPHLSYAVQWFIFAAVAIVGYPLVLRRVARQPETT